MNAVESFCIAARHNRYLARAGWLWDLVRPVYNGVLAVAGRRGLRRVINGSDTILVSPAFRGFPEVYEPEVWACLMSEVKKGDVVADVGAYVGVYTVCVANRIGSTGRMIAFEPDPKNAAILTDHVRLNGLEDRVKIVAAAVGSHNGFVEFSSNQSESHVSLAESDHSTSNLQRVPAVTLDHIFANDKLDVLKIDVEGFEEMVLRGAENLLTDPSRCPRTIFIEVHPYAWPELGVSSDSLLSFLNETGYHVKTLSGDVAQRIESYGEVIARKQAAGTDQQRTRVEG